jgi:hypothetical protein
MSLLYSTSYRVDIALAVVLIVAGLWLFLDVLNDNLKNKNNAKN